MVKPINGTRHDDTLYIYGEGRGNGRAGNDTLFGDDARNHLDGGVGNDSLFGGGGNDFLAAGQGDDVLHGGAGDDLMWGGAGSDSFTFEGLRDTARGQEGRDVFYYSAQPGEAVEASHVFDGGADRDAVVVNLDHTTVDGSPAMLKVYVGSDGNASLGAVDYPDQSQWVNIGDTKGVEEFWVSGDTRMIYHGGALDATVVGGAREDRFVSGSGNESFHVGAPDDLAFDMVVFDFTNVGDAPSHDRVYGFNPAQDEFGYKQGYEYDPTAHVVQVEDYTTGSTFFHAYSQGEHVGTTEFVGTLGIKPAVEYGDFL